MTTKVGKNLRNVYDSVADAVADVSLRVGEKVETLGYYSANDGGGANYVVVANATGTNNGGSYHDTTNGLQLELDKNQVHYLPRWGVIPDGVTDHTNQIKIAMSYISNTSDLFYLTFGEGVTIAEDLRIPDKVMLVGKQPMNGWARLTPSVFTEGSVIKLKDGSNKNLIFIEKGTQNVGVIDLILDGNKDNQTSYGSHCIYGQQTDFRAFGVIIKGNKIVNAKGWGIFLNGTGPVEIEDNFIMSGLFTAGISDYKIRGNTIDGTDGLHPTLTMHLARNGSLNDNIVYGWGEDGTTNKTLQTLEVTVDSVTNLLTVSGVDTGWLYEGCPVTIGSTGTLPSVAGVSDYRIFFASEISGNTFKLESKVPLTSGSTGVNFTSNGTGTIYVAHGGTVFEEEIFHFDLVSSQRNQNNRFAGSKGAHGVMNMTNNVSTSNMMFYSSNHRGLSNTPALLLRDCNKNSFSTCQLGTLASEVSKFDYNIHLTDYNDTCNYNKFAMDNQYLSSLTGVLIKDETTQSYKDRNIFEGIAGIADAGTVRIESPNFFRQPSNQVVIANGSASQPIPDNSVTVLNLTDVLSIGATVNPTDIEIQTTADGVYNVRGQVTIEGYDNTLSVANLTCSGFSTSAQPTRRISSTVSGSENNTRMTIPFNFVFQSTSDGTINLTFDLYLFNSGTGTIVNTSPEYTSISVTKESESTSSI